MSNAPLVEIATIALLGGVAQWLSWRLRIPSILLLLLFGLLAGPVTGVLHPDALLGELLLPVVALAVALILYEGGLSLRLTELPKVGGVVRNLVSIGAVVTWLVAAAGAHFLFQLGVALSILLGAIVVVTGPTVILPLLRHIRPTGSTGAILKWESIVIDPIGAVLAVLVFEVIALGSSEEATTFLLFAVMKSVLVGGGLGLAGAGILTLLLLRNWIPDYLQNASSLMLVVTAFTAANSIQHESGLIAVTVMGIALANQRLVDVRHIVEFKENLRVLLISALFILLAARVHLPALVEVIVPGAAYVALLILVARPLSVYVSTIGSSLNVRERIFLAGIAPRGIVAAAVSSVFALRLDAGGMAHADRMVPITFTVIVGTVAIYGLLAPLLAHRLRIADPNPQGVLFVGASRWARELATVLVSRECRVLVVDTNREHTAIARMAGLRTYSGSILADYAVDELDLGGIGYLLAVTPNDWVNALAVQRFSRIFGRSHCYQLPPHHEGERKRPVHTQLHGRWLFDPETNHSVLESRTRGGAVIKATKLSKSFNMASFHTYYGESAVPMILVNDKSKLRILTVDETLEPEPGQTLIALVDEPASAEPMPATGPTAAAPADPTQSEVS